MLDRGSIHGVFARVQHADASFSIDEDIRAKLSGISLEDRDPFASEKTFEVIPEHARMPGSKDGPFESIRPVDFTLTVNQEWEIHLRFEQPF
jgi:hypothetical protein